MNESLMDLRVAVLECVGMRIAERVRSRSQMGVECFVYAHSMLSKSCNL